VTDEHAPTAVALDAEFVQNLFRILVALVRSLVERFPVFGDDVATGETPDRYHHD